LREGSGKCVQLPQSLPYRVEPCTNNKSAEGKEAALRALFMKNVKKGVMVGPFDRPPWPNVHAPKIQAVVSPSGIARKNATWANHAKQIPELAELLADHPECLELGKERPTFDGSAPHDRLKALSVNGRQRGSRVQMFYTSVETLATLFLTAGPGAFVITFDVQGAYNTLLAREKDLNQFVVKAQTKNADGSTRTEYFAQIVHPFGTQDAVDEWQAFANTLLWILVTKDSPEDPLALKLWAHYVDNFWAALKGVSRQQADQALEELRALLRRLKVPFHEDYCAQTVEAIGWRFSTVPVPCIAFKPCKYHLAMALAVWLQSAKALKHDQLLTVAGFFSWISRPLPILRPFTSETYSLVARAESSNHAVTPSKRLRQGAYIVEQILLALPPDHSFRLHRGHESSTEPEAFLRSDASGEADKGAGALAILGAGKVALLFSHRWTPAEYASALREKRSSSTQLELLALLLALREFSSQRPALFRDALVDAELDSKAACECFVAGYSRVPAVNAVLKELYIFMAEINVMVRPRHVLREENSSTDALSKQALQVRRCAPTARPQPTSYPSPPSRCAHRTL
jgi:hypothetical protein